MGLTKFLVDAHGKIVHQFFKTVLVDRVIDIYMLILTKAPTETGPIRCVGRNFNTVVTRRIILKIVPKMFNSVPYPFPTIFFM